MEVGVHRTKLPSMHILNLCLTSVHAVKHAFPEITVWPFKTSGQLMQIREGHSKVENLMTNSSS